MMKKHTKCHMNEICKIPHRDGECERNCYYNTIEVKSNADRIRAMSDEELAEKIGESIDCEVCKTMHHSESGECPSRPHQSCVDFWLDWLRQEAQE